MTIAREEIFAPSLCILPYDTVEDAIRWPTTRSRSSQVTFRVADKEAQAVANRIRAPRILVNGPA